MSELRVMVADIVKDELSLAKIVFNKNEVDKNEVSREVWAGSHLKDAPQMKRVIVKNKARVY